MPIMTTHKEDCDNYEHRITALETDNAQLQRRLDAAAAIMQELKEDLAGELADRYSHCLDYPSMKRKYDQDMEPVKRAREWLAEEGERDG